MPLTSLYQLVTNSVVQVLSLDGSNNIVSSGTGSLLDPGNLVLTCAHCVVPGTKIGIADPSKPGHWLPAPVLFANQSIDIAILNLQRLVGKPVSFANSSTCAVGNGAFVVGYPMNITEQTLFSAHIASITKDHLRIDASVNHGNSGGPLFNLKGEQIGVINAKHGSLSAFLEYTKSASPGARMSIGGFDAVSAIRELIYEMQKNLNLGIGYAIPTALIKPLHPILTKCIP